MKIQRAQVTLQLFYIHTNEYCDEPILTIKELDDFMKDTPFWGVKGSRYIHFVESVMYGKVNDIDAIDLQISYQNEGKLNFSFNLDGYIFKNLEDIKNDILYQSFEDGMYETEPGGEAVVPTRNLYEENYQELGLIDCRHKDCIKVEFI
jgi:hypothetical protein